MRFKLVITRSGEAVFREELDKHQLPAAAFDAILADAQFDLDEDGKSKLNSDGEGNFQYRLQLHEYQGYMWFRFEIDREASPTELRILDCRFIRGWMR